MGGFQMEEMKEQSLKVQKAGLLIDELPEFDLSTGVDGNGEVQMHLSVAIPKGGQL